MILCTHRDTFLVGGGEVAGGNSSGSIVGTLHIQTELHRTLRTEITALTVLQSVCVAVLQDTLYMYGYIEQPHSQATGEGSIGVRLWLKYSAIKC